MKLNLFTFNFREKMRNFIFNIAIFSATIILTIQFYSIPLDRIDQKNNYLAAINIKHKRIEDIKNNKILFVGGSNLAFGIDSKKIEDALGQPIVNLGMHGGLGLNFMLNEAAAVIKNGDTVILSIEYYLSTEGDFKLQKEVTKYFPKANDYITTDYLRELSYTIQEKAESIRANISFLKNKIINNTLATATAENNDALYHLKNFNVYGDMIGHLNMKSVDIEIGSKPFKISYEYYKGIQLINYFIQIAKEKNVTVYFIFPPYPSYQFNMAYSTIKKYEADLKRDLNAPILTKPEDSIYDKIMFFDTIYHLNKTGRAQHTQFIINTIKNCIKKLPSN